MRLRAVVVENFRAYKKRTCIDIDDLTALIGKNDCGKSSVLEALEIFFNSDLVKIDAHDSNKGSDSPEVTIGCVFDDLPESLVLDESANTTLANEYLLNAFGCLEIHKVYNCSLSRITPKVYAIAEHPTVERATDLLQLKNSDLKARLKELNLDNGGIDLRRNPVIRHAIWSSFEESSLELQKSWIPLDKQDGKKIWERIEAYLPSYALFKADRPSTDADAEVQDPMKMAVRQAIKSVEPELEKIKAAVERQAIDVATRTLEKLNEMSPQLANELNPIFSAEPRWDGFKLTLTSDDDIPVNKRGSGVRRLILLNFFRAEAERRAQEDNRSNVIYAIEEPEVSQHPANQEMLIGALLELSNRDSSQVILTTHVPRLAGLLPTESIRHVSRDQNGYPVVQGKSEDVLLTVARELGVLPSIDEPQHLKLLICAEGRSDVEFLKHVCRLLREEDKEIPDLNDDPRVVVMPLYGSSLLEWVQSNYFRNTGIIELHIYDRDADEKYRRAYEEVNHRDDDSVAFLTSMPSIENYFHIDLINESFDLSLSKADIESSQNDVIKAAVMAVKQKPKKDAIRQKIRAGSDLKKWINNAKYHLHKSALPLMKLDHLLDLDEHSEISNWFDNIKRLLV